MTQTAPDYRPMWSSLGLDLEKHDALLAALRQAYQSLFVDRPDHPAGTGRFLEIMATALSYSMADFAEAAQRSSRSQKISAMCTVFADSEIVSSVARGIPREDLALGIHEGIAGRSIGLLRRIPIDDDVVFCGGVALNECMRALVGRGLSYTVHVPEDPQIVAALGCALHGSLGE